MKARFLLIRTLWALGGLLLGLLAGRMLLPSRAAAGARHCAVPGDVNGDGRLDIGDAIYLLNHLFAGGPDPAVCPDSGKCGPPATGQTKCYDWRGDEIPCDSADYPGQDGHYQAGCPMDGRFINNGDGTVTVTCTGLMWQWKTADTNGDRRRDDSDALSWDGALEYCEDLDFGGHTDWRLPNIREVLSIVDYGRWDPAIPPAFSAQPSWYWSSSTFAEYPDVRWYVNFGQGDANAIPGRTYLKLYVRAVRGGS